MSGITIERNVSRSSRNARPSTNANTSGAWDFIASLKSREPAVIPDVLTVTPGTLAIVFGITSPRSVSSARLEMSSVPLPSSGMATTTARCDLLTRARSSAHPAGGDSAA